MAGVRLAAAFAIAWSFGLAAHALTVEELIATLSGDDNEARIEAAEQAGPLGAEAVAPVAALLASDNYLAVKAARIALEHIVADAGAPGNEAGAAAVSNAFVSLLDASQPVSTRREVLDFLGLIAHDSVANAIANLLADEALADDARMALERIPGDAGVNALVEAAKSGTPAIRAAAFHALAERNIKDAIPIMHEAASASDENVAWAAFDGLTRMGIMPTEVFARSRAKSLPERMRYTNGFLQAADAQLAAGQTESATRIYASVAAFPVSPQHACAGLIGLKDAKSPLLIEHALGYLGERGIAHVAEQTLAEAELPELDDYLKRAFEVTNAENQRILLRVIAARNEAGAQEFLADAIHNPSPAVRFTASYLQGKIPPVEDFQAAIEKSPPARADVAREYARLALEEHRAGRSDTARTMAQALAAADIDPRIRRDAFSVLENAGGAESAPFLREMMASLYHNPDDDSDLKALFEEERGLAIAAGRAYVAAHAAAAKMAPSAIDELVLVAESAFHAEVANLASEALTALGIETKDLARRAGFITDSKILGPFPDPDGTAFDTAFIDETGSFSLESIEYNGTSYTWKAVTAEAVPAVFDLESLFPEDSAFAAYAYSEINWDRETDIVFHIGTNDGCVLWLNGERIHAVKDGRPLQVDQDRVEAKLRLGRNRVLLKVLQEGGAWAFCVRVANPDGTPFNLTLERIIDDDAYLP